MQVIGHEAFAFYQDKKDELRDLSDSQLQLLLKQASRCSVRLMFEFSVSQIMDVLGFLGVDPKTEVNGFGDRRKKSTYIKAAIFNLSSLSKDINKAIDQLSYALGLHNEYYLEDDEKVRLENAEKAMNQSEIVLVSEIAEPTESTEIVKVSEAKVEETIREVEQAITTVRETAKRVTKAELKLKEQAALLSAPVSIRWESDFLGYVGLGGKWREFWVTDPYSNPVVNLVTSSGAVILSSWESTKENPYMREAIKAFHSLIDSRTGKDIEDRLLALSCYFLGSKKRSTWYAQSHEGLVLNDGERLEWKEGGNRLYLSECFDSYDLTQGSAYKKAQHIAREYPGRYEYYEGFALVDNKLFAHAWVKDKREGKAVDVTFTEPKIQLFGIRFDIEWVDKVVANRRSQCEDSSLSPRNLLSMIEGDYLEDFYLLRNGSPIKTPFNYQLSPVG